MAVKQGMCKNCGALIVFDDRDDKCECVFCNCVFPSSEALEIMADPEGREFPNEKFDKSTDGSKHNQTRVYSDEGLEKAITRAEMEKARKVEETKVNNEYEVSPNDVKAPVPVLLGTIGAIVAIVVIVTAVALPMYRTRTELHEKMNANIMQVFDGIVSVDISEDDAGNVKGYCIYGQTAQSAKFLTSDEVTEEQARQIYENYCSLRAEQRGAGGDAYSGVSVQIYCGDGIFSVYENQGQIVVDHSN